MAIPKEGEKLPINSKLIPEIIKAVVENEKINIVISYERLDAMEHAKISITKGQPHHD